MILYHNLPEEISCMAGIPSNQKQPQLLKTVFYKKVLSFFNIDRGVAFWSAFGFKCNRVAFLQLAEFNTVQIVGVKKQIITASILSDKTEVFISQSFDSSLHIDVKIGLIK